MQCTTTHCGFMASTNKKNSLQFVCPACIIDLLHNYMDISRYCEMPLKMDRVISQGEAKQKRHRLSEPEASFRLRRVFAGDEFSPETSFQGAAQQALEISPIHLQAVSNAPQYPLMSTSYCKD